MAVQTPVPAEKKGFSSSDIGYKYKAGFFLMNDEQCYRETRMAEETVFAGQYWPSEDENVEGIVYETVYVESGCAAPISLVTRGTVNREKLDNVNTDIVTALEAKGFVFVNPSAVERPY